MNAEKTFILFVADVYVKITASPSLRLRTGPVFKASDGIERFHLCRRESIIDNLGIALSFI